MAEPDRVAVPDDRRDLPGGFRYRRPIEVRFGDTDAMGHVNNAAYLTYCEMARAGYYETVTGHQLPLFLASFDVVSGLRWTRRRL